MSVVLLADGAIRPPQPTVSPLAELGSALHRLTSVDHGESRWAARTWAALPEPLRAECRLFSAIWGGYRWRLLLPTSVAGGDIAQELDRVAATPPARFAELSAYALTGSHRDSSAAWLRRRARGRGCGPAADLLLADPDAFRSRLLAVLDDCRTAFFAAQWPALAAQLSAAAARARDALTGADPLDALGRLIRASRRDAAPDRLVIDKLAHVVVDLARTDLLLVPTVLGAPHLLVKNDPGLPAVLQFPAESAPPRRTPVPRDVLTARLRVLADPIRLQVCRATARHPRSTKELAETLRMSAPEMSRHLRVLREVGMVSTERDGRFVLYTLRHDAVASLGADVLNLLLR